MKITPDDERWKGIAKSIELGEPFAQCQAKWRCGYNLWKHIADAEHLTRHTSGPRADPRHFGISTDFINKFGGTKCPGCNQPYDKVMNVAGRYITLAVFPACKSCWEAAEYVRTHEFLLDLIAEHYVRAVKPLPDCTNASGLYFVNAYGENQDVYYRPSKPCDYFADVAGKIPVPFADVKEMNFGDAVTDEEL